MLPAASCRCVSRVSVSASSCSSSSLQRNCRHSALGHCGQSFSLSRTKHRVCFGLVKATHLIWSLLFSFLWGRASDGGGGSRNRFAFRRATAFLRSAQAFQTLLDEPSHDSRRYCRSQLANQVLFSASDSVTVRKAHSRLQFVRLCILNSHRSVTSSMVSPSCKCSTPYGIRGKNGDSLRDSPFL